MRLLIVFAAVLLAAGCTKSNQPNQVTVAVPQMSPAAAMAKDALLAAMVRAQIATADIDAAIHTNVGVRDGAVRLGGVVRTEADRTRVVAAAHAVSGVKSVEDGLRIDPNVKTFNGGDFALATRVDAELAAQTGVNALRLRASAQDGVVTLSGSVPSPSVKETALEAVRKTSGVKRVIDKISVGS